MLNDSPTNYVKSNSINTEAYEGKLKILWVERMELGSNKYYYLEHLALKKITFYLNKKPQLL